MQYHLKTAHKAVNQPDMSDQLSDTDRESPIDTEPMPSTSSDNRYTCVGDNNVETEAQNQKIKRKKQLQLILRPSEPNTKKMKT